MLPKPSIDSIITILKKDVRRAMRMHVNGFPKPYYCSFLLRDIEWFNTWASSGSTYRKRSDRTRNVYCDIRVGSYRCDQIAQGGLEGEDEERESLNHVSVPIDDRVYDGLRLSLWRLSEAKFREALEEFSHKQARRISTVDPNSKLASFTRFPPKVSVKYARLEKVDEARWVQFCRKASGWMAELPNVSSASVEFDASQMTKIFVSTEGSVIVQHERVFSLSASFRKLNSEGALIEQELVINCATQKELPNWDEFKRLAAQKHQNLCRLIRAKRIHSFSGPVLLYPLPAGLLFHEAIGHRVEGSRLLASGEGQTFKDQVNKRIINLPLDIYDDPKLKRFEGRYCIGAYDYDDEGSPARRATLVEDGILKGFLSTRAGLSVRNFVPNGHARTQKAERPISRMAITVVKARESLSMDQLRELLIDEINEQNKPFGMIIYEVSGGETETATYDFQAFAGDISFATLVYPDGREACVRGVNFVGTPLQALNNIIAAGDYLEIDNAYCAAESGIIPVTTLSPAVLLSNLELQAKEEELVTQFILPRPKLKKPRA